MPIAGTHGRPEYRCVYGEDAESALRFLFNATAPKQDSPFEGIPDMLYLDNGPVARSLVFQTVMERLGVDWRTHMPAGSDGTRPTARSKGKVERPFRTVKEAHETLYHFHKPETEAEANAWLSNFVVKYNDKPHRREAHSRIEDWIANLPESGFREMCSWERFCAFAREPERRKVGSDAHLSIEGVRYEVDAELAGEEVFCGGGCSITNSTSNGATSVSDPIGRRTGQSLCTVTASARSPRARSGPRRSPPWRHSSPSRDRRRAVTASLAPAPTSLRCRAARSSIPTLGARSPIAKSVSIPGPSFANDPSRDRGCLRAERSMIASRYTYVSAKVGAGPLHAANVVTL